MKKRIRDRRRMVGTLGSEEKYSCLKKSITERCKNDDGHKTFERPKKVTTHNTHKLRKIKLFAEKTGFEKEAHRGRRNI
jgi:hypothetical protein